MVWGRDGPISEPDIKPDDAVLFDLLAELVLDEPFAHSSSPPQTRRRSTDFRRALDRSTLQKKRR